MKRNLIAIAAVGLALGTNAALASEWAFDDPYWKQAATVQSAQSVQSTETAQGNYDLVDRYNP